MLRFNRGSMKTKLIFMTTITLDLEVVKNILRYCEIQQVYDKLSAYGDFYYKLQAVVEQDHPSTDNVLNLPQWKLREKVRNIVDSNCKEIPWEGTEVNKSGMVDDILQLIKP